MEERPDLENIYQQAKEALSIGQQDRAGQLLKQILLLDEDYLDAAQLLAGLVAHQRRRWYNDRRIWGTTFIIIIACVVFLTKDRLLELVPIPHPRETPKPTQIAYATVTEIPTRTPTHTITPTPTAIPLSWARISIGEAFWRDTVTAIALNPSDPDMMYVGTENAGIYKSIDGGISWQPIHNGLGRAWIHSIVIDPVDPSTIYVGVSTGGVFKTTDGGQIWFEANTGLTDFGWEGAAMLALDPQDSQHLLFTAQNGLYETRNSGESWVKIHWTHPSKCFLNVKFHPTDSHTLFAVARYEDQGEGELCQGGIFKSEDGGQTWEGIGLEGIEILCDLHQTLAIDQQNGDLLYVNTKEGIYGSRDGGETWQFLTGDPCRSLEVAPDNGNIAYCVSWEAILITSNGGHTWKAYEGIYSYESGITAIAVSPHDPQTLIYGGRGVLVSNDGGETWTERNNGLGAGRIDLTLDPLNSTLLYLEEPRSGSLYRSADGGRTWVLLTDSARDLAFDSAGKFLYRNQGDELIRSHDGGQSWERLPIPIEHNSQGIASHPKESQRLYLTYGRDNPPYLFFSKDGGNTWESAVGMESIHDGRLFFDNDLGNVVYVFGDSDSFRSEDGGETWDRCEFTGEWHSRSASRLVVDPRNSDRLILATRGGGVLISEDGCQSWRHSNMGLGNLFVNTVAIDLENPDTIYAGTDSGVYISFDGGEYWGETNSGLLGALVVYSIVVDPIDPSNVYAATPYGIFKLESR